MVSLLLRDNTLTRRPTITLPDQFLQSGQYLRNWSKTTLRTYAQGLNTLGDGVPTKQSLDNWVIGLRERGLTPGGVNMYVRTVNSYLTWLKDEGHLPAPLRVKLLRAPVIDAKRRRFDVVVCWRLDRLGRNLKHLITLLEDLQALGVAFVSLSEGIDATTPAGKLQMHILGAIAEFERERIRERVLAGLQRVERRESDSDDPRRPFRLIASTALAACPSTEQPKLSACLDPQ